MTSLLATSELRVAYGRRAALKSVDVEIENQGRVVGLFGQNGAGKTTFIRVIAGIINKYSGSFSCTSSVAYLPDEPFLYPFLRIRDVIALGQSLFPDFDADVADNVYGRLGLDLQTRISETSKGMSEQVHLAFVLSRRCDFYVFDEPLAAVDPLTRDRLISMIREFRKDGSTVLISTHLIGGLEGLFDEALVVHDGRVILHSEAAEISMTGGLEARFKEIVAGYGLAH